MVQNTQLVALTPAELPATQAALADWCLSKMRDLGQEYRELSANLAIAKRNRWSRGGLISATRRTKQRIQHYRKIRVAVQAGYLIVPNFPIEVIAVRVREDSRPRYKTGRYASDVNTAEPHLLPAGEGEYVNELTNVQRFDNDEKGNPVMEAGYFNPTVDFPVVGIKPVIMEATARAMALRLFDKIGIANHSGRTSSRGSKRADPIVIGQILDPRYRSRWNEKPVSFFIAWWLDTSVL